MREIERQIETPISLSSIQNIVHEDLGLKAFHKISGQELSDEARSARKQKAEHLLAKYAHDDCHKKMVFTDEKVTFLPYW